MMIEMPEIISRYSLTGAKITSCLKYYEGRPHVELWLTDDEYARTGVRKLGITFYNAKVHPEIERREILSSEVCGIDFEATGTGLTVELESGDRRVIKLTVTFDTLQCTEYEYDGMSYDNIYEEMMSGNGQFEYMFAEQYMEYEEECDPGQGYRLMRRIYTDSKEVGGMVSALESYSVVLMKDDQMIFSYRVCADAAPGVADKVILHSDGREYFLFKESLYGLSVLDIADQKVYRYIPRGEEHDRDYPCGESFIITGIHYDPSTDLIAFDGCFWACPGDVMAGDFSDPMEYNPRYVGIHRIIDPEYDEIIDIDFVSWESGVLNCTGGGKTFSVSADTIRDAIKTGKYMC